MSPAVPPGTAASTPALVAGVDVDAVVAALHTCPGVAAVTGGTLGSAATYLPGRRVTGVVVREQPVVVEVHVSVFYGGVVSQVAEEVRAAVRPLVGGHPVDVVVDDVFDPLADVPTDGADRPTTVAVPPVGEPVAAEPVPVMGPRHT